MYRECDCDVWLVNPGWVGLQTVNLFGNMHVLKWRFSANEPGWTVKAVLGFSLWVLKTTNQLVQADPQSGLNINEVEKL